MQYNKSEFRKTNDKKVMRKVKKQWVVASVATLAVLGGFAVSGTLSMNQPGVVAHAADQLGGGSTSPQPNSDTSEKASSQGSTDGAASGAKQNDYSNYNGNYKSDYQSAYDKAWNENNVPTDSSSNKPANNNGNKTAYDDYSSGKTNSNDANKTSYENTSNGFNDKVNNKTNSDSSQTSDNDYKNGQTLADAYKKSMDQGAQDAIAGNRNDQYKDNAYYNNSYDGATKAKEDYNNAQSQSKQGTSDKDYNQYSNTVQNKNDADNNSSVGIQGNPSDSSNNYNSNNGVPTGNSDSYNASTNSGGANNPDSSSNSTQTYNNYLDNKFNGTNNGKSTNSSVQSNTVDVPENSSVNVNNDQSTNLHGVNADVYAYGYNYFLANQAALDYELGKWKGTYYKDSSNTNNNNGSDPTIDAYTSSHDNSTGTYNNNAYYQGYIGAQDAVNKQWNNNNINTGNISDPDSSNSQSYLIGYNSVKKNVNENNVVYVSNGNQLNSAITSGVSTKNNIKLINDISLNQNINGGTDVAIGLNSSSSLNFDGQNHIADFNGTQFKESDGSTLKSMNINNIKTLYGTGIYGPFYYGSGGSINYSNINYVGTQLLSAQTTSASFGGNDNVHLVGQYTSPFGQRTGIDTGQENLEVGTMTLNPGANYFGNQSNSQRQIYVNSGTSGVVLGQNSKMTLLSNPNNTNYVFINNSPLNINSGANLNIIANNGEGLSNSNDITVNGGTLNIESNNKNSTLLTSSGKINVQNGGLLQVKLKNGSTSPIISANLNIKNGGNAIINDLNNDSGSVRWVISGSLTIDNIGQRGVLLRNNGNTSSDYATNGITGTNVSVYGINGNTDPKNSWFYQFNTNGSNNYQYSNATNQKTLSGWSANSLNGSLNIYSIPTVSYKGPFSTIKNNDGSVTVIGYANVSGYNQAAGDLIFDYKYGTAGNSSSTPNYDDLSNRDVQNYTNKDNPVSGDGYVPFSFTVSANSIKNLNGNTLSVGTRSKYGTVSQDDLVANLDSDGNIISYTDTKSNSPFNSSNQTISSDSVSGYKAGLSDEQNVDNPNHNSQKNSDKMNRSQDYKNAYESAQSGYKEYSTNPNLNLPTDLNKIQNSNNISDPGSYVKAYNQAKEEVSVKGETAGAQDFIDGKGNSKQTDTNYNNGYTSAKQGYGDALSGNTSLSTPTSQTGYNMGKNVVNGDMKKAYQAAEAAPDKGAAASGVNGDNVQTYNGAAQAINDVKASNGNTSSLKDKNTGDKNYNLAYNQAKSDAITANTAGQNAALNNGQPTSYNHSTSNDAVYNKANTDTKKGYADGLNGADTNPAPGSNESAGKSAGETDKQAYEDALTDYNKATDKKASANTGSKAYQNAYKALQDANGNGANAGTKTDNSNKSPIYSVANSQELGRQAALQAIKKNNGQNVGTINNDSNTAKDSSATDKQSFADAYNNVVNGYTAGQNKTSATANPSGALNKEAFSNGKQAAGANAFNSGQKNDNTRDTDYTNGYDDAKNGYSAGLANDKSNYANASQAYKDAFDKAHDSKDNVNKGIDQATKKSDGNPTTDDNTGLTGDALNAYKGTAAAYQKSKDTNGTISPLTDSDAGTPAYKYAYNQAVNEANNANQAAQDDFNNGTSLNPNKFDPNKAQSAVYEQAYKNYQKGYQEGLSGKNPERMTPNEQAGYDKSKNLAPGYNAAVQDYYDKGVTDPANSTSAYKGDPSYIDTIKGLVDGNKNPTHDNGDDATNKPVYEIARAQSIGAQNGVSDAKSGNTTNAPTGVNINTDAYQAAHDSAKKGYQASQNSENQDYGDNANNPIYTHSFDQGAKQKGADDYLAGNPVPINMKDPFAKAYNDGHDVAEKAYTKGEGNSDIANAAKKASESYNKGLDAAKNNQPKPDASDQAAVNAYWGAQAGANTGNKPSEGDNVQTNSPAYTSAKAQAQNDAAEGAKQYQNDMNANGKPSTPSSSNALINQGYNNAKAYNEGFNSGDNSKNSYDPTSKSGEHASYQNGVNAKAGYDSVMNHNAQHSGVDTNSQAYKDGVNEAKGIEQGAQAAAQGGKTSPNPSDSNVNNGFKAAQEAIKQAVQDSKDNKNQKDGKLDPSQISVPNEFSTNPTRQAYIDTYKGAYNGYNAGLNGGSAKPDASKDADYANNPVYKAAYDSSFKQGQNDVPAPSAPNDNGAGAAGSNDLLNNKRKTSFDNNDQKQAYDKARSETQSGFDDAIKNAGQNANGSQYYNAGYKAAQQGLAGMGDAKTVSNPKSDGSASYYDGFNGYKAGTEAAKRAGKLNKNDLNGKGVVYSYAFNQAVKTENRRQNNQGTKAGLAAAKSGKMATNLGDHSAAYVQAYKKAYRKEFVRHTPKYVYNIKGMYLHRGTKFVKATRVKGYAKGPRAKAHVFKVEGVSFSKTGLPRYRVAGGYITANGKHVADAYYRHNETKANQKIRVIKGQGTYIYNSKSFNKKTAVKKMKLGSVVRVKRVENLGSITRFYIGDGKYISSNKTIVEHVR